MRHPTKSVSPSLPSFGNSGGDVAKPTLQHSSPVAHDSSRRGYQGDTVAIVKAFHGERSQEAASLSLPMMHAHSLPAPPVLGSSHNARHMRRGRGATIHIVNPPVHSVGAGRRIRRATDTRKPYDLPTMRMMSQSYDSEYWSEHKVAPYVPDMPAVSETPPSDVSRSPESPTVSHVDRLYRETRPCHDSSARPAALYCRRGRTWTGSGDRLQLRENMLFRAPPSLRPRSSTLALPHLKSRFNDAAGEISPPIRSAPMRLSMTATDARLHQRQPILEDPADRGGSRKSSPTEQKLCPSRNRSVSAVAPRTSKWIMETARTGQIEPEQPAATDHAEHHVRSFERRTSAPTLEVTNAPTTQATVMIMTVHTPQSPVSFQRNDQIRPHVPQPQHRFLQFIPLAPISPRRHIDSPRMLAPVDEFEQLQIHRTPEETPVWA